MIHQLVTTLTTAALHTTAIVMVEEMALVKLVLVKAKAFA